MQNNSYFVISDNSIGIGALHRNALCYLAYGSALASLKLTNNLSEEWIKKISLKKVSLEVLDGKLQITIKLPVKMNEKMIDTVKKTQKYICETFSKLLDMDLVSVNIIIENIYFKS